MKEYGNSLTKGLDNCKIRSNYSAQVMQINKIIRFATYFTWFFAIAQ